MKGIPQQTQCKFKPLIKATIEGKKCIQALSIIGYRQAKVRIAYREALSSNEPEDERRRLCEWDSLREQQLEILQARLLPPASLRREIDKETGDIISLKITWKEGEGSEVKTKTVDPSFNNILSESVYYRGDTLLQIFHTAKVGFREFKNPTVDIPGTIPIWVEEWENSGYDLDIMPPSFPEYANITDV